MDLVCRSSFQAGKSELIEEIGSCLTSTASDDG